MSNEEKVIPEVDVELGGKTRTFAFSMYSISKLKKLIGKNPLRGEIDLYDPDHTIAFVWAGLIEHDKTLDGKIVDGKPDAALEGKLEEVARWLSFDSLPSVTAAVARAFSAAVPVKKEGGEEEKK